MHHTHQHNGFVREDPWRIFRIMAEFVDSFETLSHLGPAVTIFGSARTKPSDRYYKAAVQIAHGLVDDGVRREFVRGLTDEHAADIDARSPAALRSQQVWTIGGRPCHYVQIACH